MKNQKSYPSEKRTIYHDVYIGNVRGTTTEDHVRGQLTDIGVSEIGTITRLPSRYNSAYRVFIGDLDIENTVYNRNNWNARIKVEPFRKRPPSENQQAHAQSDAIIAVINRPTPCLPCIELPAEMFATVHPALIAPLMEGVNQQIPT